MELVWYISSLNSTHGRDGWVGVFYIRFHIYHIGAYAGYLHFAPSDPLSFPNHPLVGSERLAGMDFTNGIPCLLASCWVWAKSAKKPGGREESEVELLITWHPFFWVSLSCLHSLTKTITFSTLSTQLLLSLIPITVLFPCPSGSRNVDGALYLLDLGHCITPCGLPALLPTSFDTLHLLNLIHSTKLQVKNFTHILFDMTP